MLTFVLPQPSTLDASESDLTQSRIRTFVLCSWIFGCPVQHSNAGTVLGQGLDAAGDATLAIERFDKSYREIGVTRVREPGDEVIGACWT